MRKILRYEDGGDLAFFDGLADTILQVSLVTPKPGILQSHIKVAQWTRIRDLLRRSQFDPCSVITSSFKLDRKNKKKTSHLDRRGP